MARPRKRINQGLPQGLVCRNRKRADGSIVVYYYYTMADKKEVALGKDKHIAILEAAKLNMQYLTKKDNILFIEVLERYEKEVVPLKKSEEHSKLKHSGNKEITPILPRSTIYP